MPNKGDFTFLNIRFYAFKKVLSFKDEINEKHPGNKCSKYAHKSMFFQGRLWYY
jgi:hypothetical protein